MGSRTDTGLGGPACPDPGKILMVVNTDQRLAGL